MVLPDASSVAATQRQQIGCGFLLFNDQWIGYGRTVDPVFFGRHVFLEYLNEKTALKDRFIFIPLSHGIFYRLFEGEVIILPHSRMEREFW